MTTAAETYLFDSEDKIATVRDLIITVRAALAGKTTLEADEVAALFRVTDTALDHIKDIEADHAQAFHDTLGNAASPAV